MADWASLVNSLNAAGLSAFGREVQYVPHSGTPVAIKGIFESAHQAEDASPGVYAVLFVRLPDLVVPPVRGDRVLIGESEYVVFQVEADGQGGVTLSLRMD